jgi:CRP-like cAMP-binding protein
MPLSDLSSSHGSVVNLLRSLFFFADLPGPELAALAQQALRRTFDPGQMIFLEGEPSAGLWIIDSGTVKVFKLAADGREHVLHLPGGRHRVTLPSHHGVRSE